MVEYEFSAFISAVKELQGPDDVHLSRWIGSTSCN
jgi:hypothetical protein